MLTISYLSGFGKDPDLVCFSSKPLLRVELLKIKKVVISWSSFPPMTTPYHTIILMVLRLVFNLDGT